MIPADLLRSLPLIADGGVGEYLQGKHQDTDRPPEGLNLARPELVQAAHADFLNAGAVLLRTNTRHANRMSLEPFGLEARTEAINNAGAALARAAAGDRAVMMGAIGRIPPGASAESSRAARERAYGEQIVYLSDTNVQFFLLEHFSLLEEARLVLRVARRNSDAPVLAQLRFDALGFTEDGISCAEAARILAGEGAEALGVSCSPAPQALLPLVETLLAQGLPVSVMAGILAPGAEAPYFGAPALNPTEFAEALAPFAELGVSILGGCCGVGPGHIQALASRVEKQNGRDVVPRTP